MSFLAHVALTEETEKPSFTLLVAFMQDLKVEVLFFFFWMHNVDVSGILINLDKVKQLLFCFFIYPTLIYSRQ